VVDELRRDEVRSLREDFLELTMVKRPQPITPVSSDLLTIFGMLSAVASIVAVGVIFFVGLHG
jgi:hypothetical protein